MQATAAIILAAGTSSRMGPTRNKLLLPLDDRPVLVHVIEAALRSQARPIVVVLGHEAPTVHTHIQRYLPAKPLLIVENPSYDLGMSTSVHAGLNALLTSEAASTLDSAVFLLGDQPLITASLIDQILALYSSSGKRIVQPRYAGQPGNPVLFALSLADELRQTSGDEGVRILIRRHSDELAILHVETPTAGADVDTWDAYLRVQAAWERETPL